MIPWFCKKHNHWLCYSASLGTLKQGKREKTSKFVIYEQRLKAIGTINI